MKIQQTCNYNLHFKSVYPVYHWTKNGKMWLPESNTDNLHAIERKLVKILNSIEPFKQSSKDSFLQKICNYVARNDHDYAVLPKVRTFYAKNGGYISDKGIIYDYKPDVYLITGSDVDEFSQQFGKRIGQAKREMAENSRDASGYFSYHDACFDYYKNGYEFVKRKSKNFRCGDKKESPAELHTILKGNNPKEFIFFKIGFFDEKSPINPKLKLFG